MSIKEFDELIGRMDMAFEYAQNLGQYVEAAKVLYRMNGELPDDLRLALDDLQDAQAAKPFVTRYRPEIRSAVSQYRQRLMSA